MNGTRENKLCVVSLGGNALIRRGEAGTIEEQFAHTRACTAQLSSMVRDGFRIVITHGNGPIVGNSHGCFTLLFSKNRNEKRAKSLKPTLPAASLQVDISA